MGMIGETITGAKELGSIMVERTVITREEGTLGMRSTAGEWKMKEVAMDPGNMPAMKRGEIMSRGIIVPIELMRSPDGERSKEKHCKHNPDTTAQTFLADVASNTEK